MKVKLASRLRSLPDLDAHEIVAAQLATGGMDGLPIYKSDHIGRVIAVRVRGAIIAGPLRSVTDSLTEPLITLEIGDFKTAVHPNHSVTVAPEGSRLSVVVRP